MGMSQAFSVLSQAPGVDLGESAPFFVYFRSRSIADYAQYTVVPSSPRTTKSMVASLFTTAE